MSLFKSLDALHSHNFVHRKIKWENILYDSDSDDYLLSNFEGAGRTNESLPKYLLEDNFERFPNEIKSGKSVYSASIDLYLAAQLVAQIQYSSTTLIDFRLTDLKIEIQSNYKKMTAGKIIQKLNGFKSYIFS